MKGGDVDKMTKDVGPKKDFLLLVDGLNYQLNHRKERG